MLVALVWAAAATAGPGPAPLILAGARSGGQPPEGAPPPSEQPPAEENEQAGDPRSSEDPSPEEAPPSDDEATAEPPGEGEEGSEDPAPDLPGSNRRPDVAAAPVGILPGRLVATPAPVPGAPVVGMVLGPDGFFLHTSGGEVIAYDREGQAPRWGLPGGRAVFLAISAGKLIVLDERGDVALRSVPDGEWVGGFSTGLEPAVGLEAGVVPRPAPATLASGVLYWMARESLYGYEVSTGRRVLEVELPEGEAASVISAAAPTEDGNGGAGGAPPLLLASLGHGGVAAVSAAPGQVQGVVRWRATDTGRVTGPVLPLAQEELAVFGDERGDLHAVDLETGKRRWRWRLSEGFHHPPLASRGRLYAATKANSLYCFDAKRGGERWRAALPGRPAAPPVRMAGAVLVVTQDGLLVEFNAETGARIGAPYALEAEVLGVVRRQGDGARADGWRDRRLFLGLRDGRLAVFGPRTGRAGS